MSSTVHKDIIFINYIVQRIINLSFVALVTFIFYLTESVTFGDVSYLAAIIFTFKDRLSLFCLRTKKIKIFILLFSTLTLIKNLVFYLVGFCKFMITFPARFFGQSYPDIGDAYLKCAL